MTEQGTAELHRRIMERFDLEHVEDYEGYDEFTWWDENLTDGICTPDYRDPRNWSRLIMPGVVATNGLAIWPSLGFGERWICSPMGSQSMSRCDTPGEAVVACAVAIMEAEKEKP